ncbi:hypothetical protein A2276_08590 [candidate division WOR-1 bacterium RIFOXYA12_FULL_43_27]|nr:MAG: hypothetical protein A2276_08590 [candidate division WOR-1 bacterium RIFOXYA12_FULL_43_27]OGI36117.1 MAG: hypothetical protein A2259_05195 [Candidatus Moranbacteria bacterium RIFOXYA2_FULL_43_15]
MTNNKKKILIAEDDVFVADIYHTKLTQEGFDVAVAEDGRIAMKKLGEGYAPDLMLLDIMMPRMNGLEVLAEMKKDEKLKNIKVILLSNLSQKEEIKEGMALGAADYLVKSYFTPSEVLKKVNEYLK